MRSWPITYLAYNMTRVIEHRRDHAVDRCNLDSSDTLVLGARHGQDPEQNRIRVRQKREAFSSKFGLPSRPDRFDD
jgi:hypothetical protein